ncbi:MAG: Stp1/IreP family PP2C-type Ser/Thr phosphatase [Oscillospiraceae bacterium]|nr:Stp1/IreP family PP2C-type Ser/Thr phosphatase [Oscillospiraceae bacterium]
MKVFSETNIGLSRSENQDRVRTALIRDDIGFVVICDGMGGQNAGSEASERAVNIVYDRITKVFRPDYDRNSIRNLLISSVTTANSVVYDMAMSSAEMSGMGTTCVAALVHGHMLYGVNVGDSRLYVISHEIRQVSKDHTVVMRMYENGEITKEQLKNHPQRNYITRAVGVSPRVAPDYFEADLSENAMILLCTDGLSNYCDESDIFQIAKKYNSEEVPGMLIKKALDNGGGDNITAAVIQMEKQNDEE